jgi:hypothetical protein
LATTADTDRAPHEAVPQLCWCRDSGRRRSLEMHQVRIPFRAQRLEASTSGETTETAVTAASVLRAAKAQEILEAQRERMAIAARDFKSLMPRARLFCRSHGRVFNVARVAGQRTKLLCGCTWPIATAETKSHRFALPNSERTEPQIEIDSADVILSDSLVGDEQPKPKKSKRTRSQDAEPATGGAGITGPE